MPFFVEKQQWGNDNSKIITFKNSSEQLVEQSIGKNVFLPLSTLPKLSGNQFYYHEVIGYEIREEDGKSWETLLEMNDQTAQHYFDSKISRQRNHYSDYQRLDSRSKPRRKIYQNAIARRFDGCVF